MGLGSKVDDKINSLNGTLDYLVVSDVSLDEFIVGIALNIFEVFQIACVSEDIEVDDGVFRMVFDPIMDEVRTDKTSSASNEKFHI
jgi:hypothetical protein